VSSPIYRRKILPSARYTAARAYSSRPRPAVFVTAVILLLPLIAFLQGQAALAQTYRASQRSVWAQQQAPQQQLPQDGGTLLVPGGYAGTGFVEWQAAPAQPSRAKSRASRRSAPTVPQALQQKQQQALQRKHNEGTLLILGGYPGTAYFNLAHDMVAALSGSADLRLIALDAPGGMESLRDLLLLRGVDLALVPENVLYYADATAALGPGLRERLTYVTPLYGEEVHILAGPGVSSVDDLSGKKVAVPPQDGNAEFTARDLFQRLHVDAEFIKVAAADAIDDVRSGTLAALVLVGGKPLHFVAGLPRDGTLHLLALPSAQNWGDGYSPSSLGADDYPALISEQQTIDTVSVAAVLVANNVAKSGESYQRIARFVPAFFGALSELAGPRWHPKWGEVNLAATLTKWPRFPEAKEWLDGALREQAASVQRDFDNFLRVNSVEGSPTRSPEARKQLFEEYLKWTRSATGAH
jgi:TRAP-type uncharacterized transport system substrate-binding protein